MCGIKIVNSHQTPSRHVRRSLRGHFFSALFLSVKGGINFVSCWFSSDSLMRNSDFEIYFLATIVIQKPREVTKGRTFPPFASPPP